MVNLNYTSNFEPTLYRLIVLLANDPLSRSVVLHLSVGIISICIIEDSAVSLPVEFEAFPTELVFEFLRLCKLEFVGDELAGESVLPEALLPELPDGKDLDSPTRRSFRSTGVSTLRSSSEVSHSLIVFHSKYELPFITHFTVAKNYIFFSDFFL